MPNLQAKRPQLSDGTPVNYRSLLKFVKDARVALENNHEEDAAHYFGMFEEFLEKDVINGKPLEFTYKVLGL